MRVLVAVASRHGGTQEIGEFIAAELTAQGIDAELRDVREDPDVTKYDAVVLGSAVYMGNWLADASVFWEQNRDELKMRPLWLFSSGPIGEDDPKPHGEPAGIKEILKDGGAVDHRVFTGKLDYKNLGFLERLIARGVHAPDGDFRDWDDVRGWARDIGQTFAVKVAA